MTVPHISAPAWTVRHGIGIGAEGRGLSRRFTDAAVARVRRVAWIDVAIQLVVGGLMIALLWAVATSGLFQRGVVGFSEWYVGDVAPMFSAGTTAVMPGVAFEGAVFGVASTDVGVLSPAAVVAGS